MDNIDLGAQRCFRHANREAAARCPQCRRFFCRECVTEHAGRVICSACLAALPEHNVRRGDFLRRAGLGAAAGAGFVAVWLAYFGIGHWLAQRPSSFHETSLWREQAWQQP